MESVGPRSLRDLIRDHLDEIFPNDHTHDGTNEYSRATRTCVADSFADVPLDTFVKRGASDLHEQEQARVHCIRGPSSSEEFGVSAALFFSEGASESTARGRIARPGRLSAQPREFIKRRGANRRG